MFAIEGEGTETLDFISRLHAKAVSNGSYASPVDGERVEYLVISREFEPELLGFVSNTRRGGLAISENVPHRYRYLLLDHERMMGYYPDYRSERLQVLQQELTMAETLLSRSGYRAYLDYRRRFFDSAAKLGQSQGWPTTGQFKDCHLLLTRMVIDRH